LTLYHLAHKRRWGTSRLTLTSPFLTTVLETTCRQANGLFLSIQHWVNRASPVQAPAVHLTLKQRSKNHRSEV